MKILLRMEGSALPNIPLMDMPRLAPAIALQMYYGDVLRVGVVLLVIAAVAVGFHLRRPRRPATRQQPDAAVRARRLLAFAFGGLWVLDGLLQMQPGMTTSFISGLVAPLLQGEPAWLAAMIGFGVRLWGINPVVWNVCATFIQLVVGVLILIGGEGPLRRAGLWVSIAWGIFVWVGGEAMGGTFVAGSWMAGWPGAVLLYIVAAALLLAPADVWRQGRWLRWFSGGMAALWLVAAGLQAWPPAGYWTPKGLYTFVLAMGQMQQPHLFAVPLLDWAAMLRVHPALWNGAIVLGLLALAAGWWYRADRPWLWWATIAWVFMTWWMGEDFGVLGGMGTDPNSGAPLILLLLTYAATQRAFARREARAESAPPTTAAAPLGGPERLW